ncbi:MAG: molybdopterin-dependent oxidoreductase [Thermodesulfobacteriota bacterium]
MDKVAKKETVTTCTRDCPSACGLVAIVEDGRLACLRGNPEHPLNRGGCCAKMKDYVRRVYSPERILHPMRRDGSRWTRISWGEALDLLADKLKACVSESGPESILHYQGYGERTALKLLNARFFAHLGGVTGLRGSLCGGTAHAAMVQDFGERISHDPLDHLNACTVILWGRNPAATQFNMTRILSKVRREGGRVWLVDPAASESLVLCDRYIQLRPGGDLHLALGAIRAALENGWHDKRFISERTEGFEKFREIAYSRSVEEHSALAGVETGVVTTLGKAMRRESPAAILLGWGMHRRKDAHLAVRAIDALSAVTGNIGIPGGGVSQGFEEYGPFDQSVWGLDMHQPRRALLMPRIGQEIMAANAPRIRAMVVSAANPACMAPDSDAVARAMESLEFTACMGHFMDDTARLSHLFLPCATFLEQDDVAAAYGHNYLGPVNKAIEPLGECRSQFDIYQDLARRFPFADEYVKPLDEWLSIICRPFLSKGFTLDQLRAGPIRDPAAPMAPWQGTPFATPSGRFRFLTSLSAGTGAEQPRVQGDDPPGGSGQRERSPLCPPEAPEAAASPAHAYPLTLLTTGSPRHLCSELSLAGHDPLPVARIHPGAGHALGVRDNSPAWLESPLGRVKVRVLFDPRQRGDVCLCRRGGWVSAGHGLNRLVAAGPSLLGDGTPYYDTRVTLRPVDSAEAGN